MKSPVFLDLKNIIILKEGYTQNLNKNQVASDCTISLINSTPKIIVDTGNPNDRLFLVKKLKNLGIKLVEIAYVISTHGHSDHVGNNNLFQQAINIVGISISKGDIFVTHSWPRPFVITKEIKVIPTPGHTPEDVSVLVKTRQGMVVITGDLFECEKDLEDENLWKTWSFDPKTQFKSRKKIFEIADWIIPGHGSMFKVFKGRANNKKMRKDLTP